MVCDADLVIRPGAVAEAKRLVRVSMSVLLRIKDDENYVLFHTLTRPGCYGPPGGVIKYFPPAVGLLEGIGFQEERVGSRPDLTRCDLRGYIPAGALPRFLRWFDSGAYRENAAECLLRELTEELGEVGLDPLQPAVPSLSYTYLRTVTEGPHKVPGKAYRQFRRFEVCDIVTANSTALQLARQVLAAASDPAVPFVLCASRASVEHGRIREMLIAPHTAFLLGSQRFLSDIPPIT